MILLPVLSGCGEDRSNLIPKDTSQSLIAHFDRIKALAASGKCFEAAQVAREAQTEIESMGPDIDAKLKRSLLDGVTDLTLLANDTEVCIEADTTTPEVPVVTPTGTEGTTGETGTTDTGTNTTGDQGTTDENQDSNQQTQPNGNGNGNGNGNQPNNPPAGNPATPSNPTSPSTPTRPSTPPNTGPGSGGLGPG